MSNILHTLLRFLVHAGYLGPFLMGILDSSFLFLPFGNDLLVVILVANHHESYLLYVASAACGSTLGVFLVDLVSRKLGEQGIEKVAGRKRFEYLSRKIGQRGISAVIIGCLAPPPFPFSMVIAILCALNYPRMRLLITVFLSRAARFLVLGYLALRFGPAILRIINSSPFKWTMVGFTVLCLIGSVFSILSWLKPRRGSRAVEAHA